MTKVSAVKLKPGENSGLTRGSLSFRLSKYARADWPDLAEVKVRFRSGFAYADGVIKDGPTIPLCRLLYAGSAHRFGFAIYLASHDGYEDSMLPNGDFSGTPEQALDCACQLYLSDPEIWRIE